MFLTRKGEWWGIKGQIKWGQEYPVQIIIIEKKNVKISIFSKTNNTTIFAR